MINIPHEFDDIRPLMPEELPRAFEELLASPQFWTAVDRALPDVPREEVRTQILSCKTNYEFQDRLSYRALKILEANCSKGIVANYDALTDRKRHYTFVSNHRDIILDSAFLDTTLMDEGMGSVEIAIGDNLLIYPWIKTLVRINKAFIVKRALGLREQLSASEHLSRYMHFAVTQKHEHIWIAQRQGRAKDSNDRTQRSIVKMIAMAGEGDAIDRIREMNLVPLAISYEFDPCDFLKAKEAQQRRDNPDFKKSPADDLNSMCVGLWGYKGHIRFKAAQCINPLLDDLREQKLNKNELFDEVARCIDHHIHSNYVIFPSNRVALDLLEGTQHGGYTSQEKAQFEAYVQSQIDKVELPNKDEGFLRQRILEMYANPLRNQMAALS